jgi:imidazolonepropionase-like amidohydrolase
MARVASRNSPQPPSAFVLREAMTLDEAGGFQGPCDVVVEGGVVVEVGRNLRRDSESLDFSGLWVLPGVVDCHIHAIATSLDTMELLRAPLSPPPE